MYASKTDAVKLCIRLCGSGIFGGKIPIGGAAGDQQSALFGQTCFTPGDAKTPMEPVVFC